MVAPLSTRLDAAATAAIQKETSKAGAALQSKPSLKSHPCDDGNFGDSETPRSIVDDARTGTLTDIASSDADAAEPKAPEADPAAVDEDTDSQPPSDLKEAPHTPEICGNGLAPSRTSTAAKGTDSLAQATEALQLSPDNAAEGESDTEDGSAAVPEVQNVAAGEALLLAVSDQATKGTLHAVRTVNTTKSCSSSDVTPPTTPPAGSTPPGEKGKPTDTSSEEASSPGRGSKPLSPVTVLPAGAHNAQEFVPASSPNPFCEAAAGGETPCLSGRSPVTLNHTAPEFKMPVRAAASGTVSVAAPAEDMPQGSAGHADGTSSEPFWYPTEDGTYGTYGYSAAYGAYTDEHGHAYYPDAYYQGSTYDGYYYDYGYGQYTGYDYNAVNYGQEQQWTFGTYDAQADPAYWQSYNGGAGELQGSGAPSVSDNEHGLATSSLTPRSNAFAAPAGSEMASVEGSRANQGSGPQRKRSGGNARADRQPTFDEAALAILQEQFTSYTPKALREVFLVLAHGELEEALDRLAQIEAEQAGFLPKQGDRKAEFKLPPKLDNEADFPVLGAPSKKPEAQPWSKDGTFIDAVRKAAANPGSPREGEAAVEAQDKLNPADPAPPAAEVTMQGPKAALGTPAVPAEAAANEEATSEAQELKKRRNMYFNKAVVSFRNDKKQTAKELAAKGLQCQTQMIQAYAAIQEAIFVAKPVRVLPRGGARNGPRAAGANRHGSKPGASHTVNLSGLQQTEALDKLYKEVSALKKDAQQNKKQRLCILINSGKQARQQGGNGKGSPKEQNRKVFKAVEAYLKERGFKFEEREGGAVEVEI